MYDPLTTWFYASKGIWADLPRKWKLPLLQIKWPSIMKLGGSIVLMRRPIVDTPQRLQTKVCTTTRSGAVPSSLDFFIKFALSFSDKWMSSKVPILKECHFGRVKLWDVEHFLSSFLGVIAEYSSNHAQNWRQKVFNVSEFHFSEVYFFQNWYFNEPHLNPYTWLGDL